LSLSAANGGYYFECVAILKCLGCELAAWNDLAVPFKRDPLAGETQLVDQCGDTDGLRELANCTVETDCDHLI
jgi:hypothetical protein